MKNTLTTSISLGYAANREVVLSNFAGDESMLAKVKAEFESIADANGCDASFSWSTSEVTVAYDNSDQPFEAWFAEAVETAAAGW